MSRSLFLLPAILLALAAAGCGSDSTTTAPDVPVQVTESFTGTVTVNGASMTTFNEAKAGTVTVTLSALAPDDSVKLGLWLGTFNGLSCAVGVAREDATLSSTLIGTANAAGTLCVRVYDNGGLTQATDYEVRVDHF
jgi:hypothetical protein